MSRGRKAFVCDLCFRTNNGKIVELKNYCQNNPKAELFLIARVINVDLPEVISFINYNDVINSNSSFSLGASVDEPGTTGKTNGMRKNERRIITDKYNIFKLGADLGHLHKSK